jgi:hypothetical protein
MGQTSNRKENNVSKGYQIFLGTTNPNGKNVPKRPQKVQNGHEIYKYTKYKFTKNM